MTGEKAILIFGAFNPPTIAHIKMGECLHRYYSDAYIVYVPSRDEYITGWKGQCKPIPFSKRFALLSGCLKDMNINSIISSAEDTVVTTGKTYDVVNYFKKKFNKVYICIGEDKLDEIEYWYKSKALIKENEFIVFQRCGHYKGDPKFDNIRFIDLDLSDISSTEVREYYLKGQLDKVKDYVPEYVYNYLKSHVNLFKENDNNV